MFTFFYSHSNYPITSSENVVVYQYPRARWLVVLASLLKNCVDIIFYTFYKCGIIYVLIACVIMYVWWTYGIIILMIRTFRRWMVWTVLQRFLSTSIYFHVWQLGQDISNTEALAFGLKICTDSYPLTLSVPRSS